MYRFQICIVIYPIAIVGYILKDILTCKIWCHCLYHASTKNWLMVTHMQLAYTSPATRSEMLILLGGHEYDTIHVLLQADMSRLGRYLKPPTHLQFYYLFEICKVELSSVWLYDLRGGMIVPNRESNLGPLRRSSWL